jgi:DNA-binding IclR family transcriptional regulator
MGSANTTADKAIEILVMFSDDAPALSAASISTELAMPRSTTYRYLASLRAMGLLVDAGESTFRLGPRLFELARIARRSYSSLQVAEPELRNLSKQTGETVLMSQISRMEISVLECLEGPGPMRISYSRGHVMPNPATASAKALLAFGDSKMLSGLFRRRVFPRYTDNTIVDPQQLRRELDRVRLLGYSVNRDEVDEGVSAIAAPILIGKGPARYAVSLAMPSFRCTEQSIPDHAAKVRATARAIGAELEEFD